MNRSGLNRFTDVSSSGTGSFQGNMQRLASHVGNFFWHDTDMATAKGKTTYGLFFPTRTVWRDYVSTMEKSLNKVKSEDHFGSQCYTFAKFALKFIVITPITVSVAGVLQVLWIPAATANHVLAFFITTVYVCTAPFFLNTVTESDVDSVYVRSVYLFMATELIFIVVLGCFASPPVSVIICMGAGSALVDLKEGTTEQAEWDRIVVNNQSLIAEAEACLVVEGVTLRL